MAEGIDLPINMPGVEQVQQAVVAFDKLTSTLTAARGSGKALEELRKLLVGLKGKSSALDDLSSSIKQMSEASAAMSRSMKTGFSNLNSVIQTEMAKLAATIQANSSNLGNVMGQGLGASATASVSTAMDGVEQVVKVRGRTLSAKMRAEATAAYEASISQFSKAGIRMPAQDVMGFKDKGANLIPEHKKQLADFKKLNDEKAAVIAAGSKKIIDAEKVAAATLIQQKQKAFDALVALEKRQTDARLRSIQNSVAVAQASPVGAYMPINAQGVTSGKVVTPKQPAVSPIPPNFNPIVDDSIKKTNIFTKALGALGFEANSTHSFIRGLASGFGALWLTWGKVGPMMLGAAASMGVVRSFNVGAQFEGQIAMAEKVGMAVDKAGRAVTNFKEVATRDLMKINEGSIFTLNELADAYVELGRTGLQNAEAIAVLKPATDLAVVGATDLTTSIDLLIQANHLFDISMMSSAKTAAQLVDVANKYPLSVKDLYGSLRYASESGTRFNQTLEGTIALFGVLSKAGIKAASAGTSVINWYRDMFGRTNASRKALQELTKATGQSVEMFDKLGRQRDMVDIFVDLDKALSKVSAQDADKFLQKFFTARGGRTQFALMRENIGELKEYIESLRNIDPSDLEGRTKALLATGESTFKIFKSYVENFLTTAYLENKDKFISFFQEMIDIISSSNFKSALSSAVSMVMSLVTVIAKLVPYVLEVSNALLALGVGFAVFQGLSLVSGYVTATATALSVATKAVIGFRLTAYSLVGVISAIEGAYLSFVAVLMANPFIVLATAIAAISTALYAYRNDIKLAGDSTATLGDFFDELAQNLFTNTIPAINDTGGAITNLTLLTAEEARAQMAVWENFLTFFGYVWDSAAFVVQMFVTNMRHTGMQVLSIIDGVIQGIINFVNGLKDVGSNLINLNFSGAVNAFKTYYTNQLNTMKGFKTRAVDLAVQTNEEIKEAYNTTVGRGVGASVQDASIQSRLKAQERLQKAAEATARAERQKSPAYQELERQNELIQRNLATTQAQSVAEGKITHEKQLQADIEKGKYKGASKAQLDALRENAKTLDEQEKAKRGSISLGRDGPAKTSREAEKERAKQQNDAEKYIKSLDNQLSKVRELSAQEKLINDIKEQGLKFSPQQLAQATELAKKIDDRVRQEQEIKDLLEQQTAERARQKTQEQFEFDVKMTDATLGMGPKQAEEFKRSAKVGFTFDQAKGDAELKYEQQLYQLQKGTLDLRAGETQAQALERLTVARAEDMRVAQEAYTQAMLNEQTLADQRLANEQNWMAGVQSALSSYAEQANDYYTQVANIAGNALNSLQEKLVDFFKTGTFDFRGLIQGIASDIISMLVKIAINAAIVQPLLASLGAQNAAQSAIATTQSVVQGNLVTDAWGPAAMAVSLATMGSNAFGATAGIMAAGLAGRMFGFASGGYTGPGGVYEPAGIVHKGEGVLSQRDMAALGGPDAFERFRASLHTGFALGGVGGSTPSPVIRNYGSSSKPDTGLTVNIIEDASKAGQVERRETEQGEDIDVFVANAIYRGGQTATALESTYGVNRVGR